MNVVRVRRIKPEDRREHVRMRAALWPDADPQELADEFDTLLADDDQVAFVAEGPNGRLCGFIEASVRPWAEGVNEHPCAFIEGWWVDEDVRRTGIGRALVQIVEAWARGRGFTELGSDAELHNKLSLRAHEALGFEERQRTVWFRKKL